MMAELRRTNDPLTTEEFARRSSGYPGGAEEFETIDSEDFRTVDSEPVSSNAERPRLVRNETTRSRSAGMKDDLDSDFAVLAAADSDLQEGTADGTRLFSEIETGDLQSRWSNIQANFVDEPRHSVEQADQLVAAAMQRLAEGFARERASLERQWGSGENVSTEDLRLALQRYRTFFGRLLNAA
jgi:hypothetical protein